MEVFQTLKSVVGFLVNESEKEQCLKCNCSRDIESLVRFPNWVKLSENAKFQQKQFDTVSNENSSR